MADREGSIYFRNCLDFDFDKAYAFLAREGINLLDKPENGNIIALDDIGDKYEIDYEEAKQKALGKQIFNLVIWFNYQQQIFWTFRSQDSHFVMDFYLGFLTQQQKDKVSKALTKLFLSAIASQPESLLGMFIDKNGETYDYSFDPVFFTDEEEVDYITDLICLPQKKFDKLVIMELGFAKKELDNGFICASRYPKFLDYVLN